MYMKERKTNTKRTYPTHELTQSCRIKAVWYNCRDRDPCSTSRVKSLDSDHCMYIESVIELALPVSGER